MNRELEDLAEMLHDMGKILDNFDDPDRAWILRLRRQVDNLTRDEKMSLRDLASRTPEGYLGWLEVGVAKD